MPERTANAIRLELGPTDLMSLFLIIIGLSLLSIIGSLLLASSVLLLPKKSIERILPGLISFASGTLLATALLGLIPESLEHLTPRSSLSVLLAGMVLFFLLEKLLLWHHGHKHGNEANASGTLILIGDGLHNFVDGFVIAATCLTSIPLGIATFLAIMAHEIPHEVGDFAILLHSGYSKRKAMLYNLLSGSSSLVGSLSAYLFLSWIQDITYYVLSLAAASFLYIATVDLFPQLQRQNSFKEGLLQTLPMLLGIALVVLLQSPH